MPPLKQVQGSGLEFKPLSHGYPMTSPTSSRSGNSGPVLLVAIGKQFSSRAKPHSESR